MNTNSRTILFLVFILCACLQTTRGNPKENDLCYKKRKQDKKIETCDTCCFYISDTTVQCAVTDSEIDECTPKHWGLLVSAVGILGFVGVCPLIIWAVESLLTMKFCVGRKYPQGLSICEFISKYAFCGLCFCFRPFNKRKYMKDRANV
mmetsp:Transcript_26435/g.30331  ORF Transcript_26435/g.30331 Transcript_26435/m.30331 type:complete len:149 (+) Transcript_26435:73-519(+)